MQETGKYNHFGAVSIAQIEFTIIGSLKEIGMCEFEKLKT